MKGAAYAGEGVRLRSVRDDALWQVRQEVFEGATAGRYESMFALSNGFLGLRANLEEGIELETPTSHRGTLLNGIYESFDIAYGEKAYGFPAESQTILNVADGQGLVWYVDGIPVGASTGEILEHTRTLDLQAGVLTRLLRWRSENGLTVRLTFRRLVSFANRHLATIEASLVVENGSAPVTLRSFLNGRVFNRRSVEDPRVGAPFAGCVLSYLSSSFDRYRAFLRQKTHRSGFVILSAMDHLVDADVAEVRSESESEWLVLEMDFNGETGREIRCTKMLSYHSSRETAEDDLSRASWETLDAAGAVGFEGLAAAQRERLARFWHLSDVRFEGDDGLQQAVRLSLFHVYQAAGRDGVTSMPAKGLTGEGYGGHYFWDTEIYGVPFFVYTEPEVARGLLEYRYSILDAARRRAAQLNHRGALFPWRTIAGEETSAFFPAGTAQYHINAGVVYALKQYLQATGDLEFLAQRGAEIVFETARFWTSLGEFVEAKGGRFCINMVTGPDEYTALVNNNFYTNLMARNNLEYAFEVATWMRESRPEEFERLTRKIELQDEEIARWSEAAVRMYLPRDVIRGVVAQDDSFLDKQVWDFENWNKHPLLLHYHPLNIYRHQVLKQADVVLAMFLHSRLFDLADKKRAFDYYDPLTTGDSSLSAGVQAIVAAEVGYTELAYRYFQRAALTDIEDRHGNTKDGVHIASMAATWLAAVSGFGGLRTDDEAFAFSPRLPPQWQSLSFRVRIRGSVLAVYLSQEVAVYTVEEGPGVPIKHWGRPYFVDPDQPVTINLRGRISAVIFALDGVITDTAELHYKAWKKLCEQHDIPFDREVNARLRGVSRMESLHVILDAAGIRKSDYECRRLAEEKNATYTRLIETLTPGDVLPGIVPLLAELEERGIRTALVSASRNAAAVLEKLGLANAFDVIADAGQVQVDKPDPEIFLQASGRLWIGPPYCVAVEEAQAGVDAIRGAGMFAVAVGNKTHGADLEVLSTAELTFDAIREAFGAGGGPRHPEPPIPWYWPKSEERAG